MNYGQGKGISIINFYMHYHGTHKTDQISYHDFHH